MSPAALTQTINEVALVGFTRQLRDGLNIGGGDYYLYELTGRKVVLVHNDVNHPDVFIPSEVRRNAHSQREVISGGGSASTWLVPGMTMVVGWSALFSASVWMTSAGAFFFARLLSMCLRLEIDGPDLAASDGLSHSRPSEVLPSMDRAAEAL